MLNTTVLYFRGGRLPVARSFYRDYRGGRWDFRFWLFFDRFFGFCVKRLRFFGFVVRCGLRIFRFLAFGFRFSVFVQNKSGFSVLLFNVVCIRFSVLAEFFAGFRVLDDFFFGSAVSNIPQCSPHYSKRLGTIQVLLVDLCSARWVLVLGKLVRSQKLVVCAWIQCTFS